MVDIVDRDRIIDVMAFDFMFPCVKKLGLMKNKSIKNYKM